MDYDKRFTNRVCLPNDEVDETVSYLPRVSEDIILQRLGMYEDLGFSPNELANILLSFENLDADQMERIKIAKKRIQAFDSKVYYLNDFQG